MAAPCYIAWNGTATALTAPLASVATSATSGTVKTMLQIKPTTAKIRIIEWGYLFTTSPTAPVTMELIETGAVAATVTALTPSLYNDVTGAVSSVTSSTTGTGFSATAEGSITATRFLAGTYDTATYFKQQFPLGREPEIAATNYLRIRATPSTSAATNVLCYVIWEE